MFCNQCEQTAHGTGCVEMGVCGKDADMQSLQETLLYGLKGMAAYAHHARRLGKVDEEVDAFIEEALFATVTNVNFDMDSLLRAGARVRAQEPPRDADARRGAREALRQARRRPRSTRAPRRAPASWSPATTWSTSRTCSSRPRARASTSTRTARCCPPTCIPSCASTSTWPGTSAAPGRSRRRSSTSSPGRSSATTNCVLIPRGRLQGPALHHPRHRRARRQAARAPTTSPRSSSAPSDASPLTDDQVEESTIGFHHIGAARPGRQDRRGGQGGQAEALLPDRRLRRRRAGPQLLLRVRREHAAGFADPDARLRQVPHPRPRLRHDRARRRRTGSRACSTWGSATTPTARSRWRWRWRRRFDCGVNDLPLTIVLSWFEQKAVAVLLTPAGPGREGHPHRPGAAGVRLPERLQDPPGQVRPQADHRGRSVGGPERVLSAPLLRGSR